METVPFHKNSRTRKLGEITVFYAVSRKNEAQELQSDETLKPVSHFTGLLNILPLI